ncbi:DNA repair protein RecN [Priestia megaterium]|nr:DNA repair protein RecN [Priestia megaterium]
MLLQVQIDQLAIIEHSLIDFTDGFHVLTGETGAGKSIILGAIGLLAGERANREMIRKGQEFASVKGTISVNKENREIITNLIGPVQDDYIIIERILYVDGRGIAKINGKIEPLRHIKEIMEVTLERCSQKSHIDLMRENYYREVIDEIAPPNFHKLLDIYQSLYKQWKAKKEELHNWLTKDREQEQMMDLYNHQIQEIEEINLDEQEEETLQEEIRRLSKHDELVKACEAAIHELRQLNWYSVEEAASSMAEVDKEHTELQDRVFSLTEEIRDVQQTINRYSNNLEYDEERLNQLVYREEEIKRIKRKYGNTIQDVLEHLEEIKQQVQAYEKKEDTILQLEKQIKQYEEKLLEVEKKLTKERIQISKKFQGLITTELQELAMPHAQFELRILPLDKRNEYGRDDVQAFFNANKGEQMQPINKIASGGEMARVLLALKVVINEQTPGKTLIFDEVDEGIGGDVGNIIGDKMERLGKRTQVIVISHLPQVAAKASHHYFIEKHVQNERTFSTVQNLTEKERVDEIARMLLGKAATKVTQEQAKKMLGI